MGTIYCPQTDTSYSTLAAFEAAVNNVDFGVQAVGEVSGTVTDTATVNFNGPYPHGVLLRAAVGEEFTGIEGVAACLKNEQTVIGNAATVTDCAVVLNDLEISNSGSYATALINCSNYTKFNMLVERCGIFNRGGAHPTRTSIIAAQNVGTMVPQSFIIRDSVVVANARALTLIGDRAANGTMLAERVTVEGINAATAACDIYEKKAGALVCKDILSLGAGVPDFNFTVASTNTNYIASGDTSSNVVTNYLTGITTADFESYGTGDYRIKNTSSLVGAGSAGGNIGAFVQGGGSDTTPDAFSFTDQTNVAVSTLTTSNTVTITGIDTATAISVTGGEMSINSGAFTSSSTTVSVNDTVQLRVTSSASNSTAVAVTLDVGGVTDEWSVTTVAASVGTITTGPFKNNTGTPQTGLSGLRVVVLDPTDGTTVLNSTGNTTHATTAVLTLSDAALTTGNYYGVVTISSDGTVLGIERIQAT